MEQITNYGDERLRYFCAYCGGGTETRDHIPPKVFLDKPYPDNLPIVGACETCNQGFSLDEEYVACLLECILVGSVKPEDIKRPKIKRILEQKPKLVSRLRQAQRETNDGIAFNIEMERVANIILKLARGHAAFELNEPQLDDPSNFAFIPMHDITADELENFKTPPTFTLFPEVGSRVMQRLLVVNDSIYSSWIIAQPGRYRYLTSVSAGIVVRMVIGEYLLGEVIW